MTTEHCRVSQWSSWSGCSQQCHPAFRHRKRHIEKEPSNSGDACPPLEERAGCLEYLDRQGRNCALALVNISTSISLLSYCVEFKMVSLTSHCAADGQPHLRWTQYLREGYTVCVACQPPAMQEPDRSCQGDGATSGRDELLHWQAVDNPHCRGTWSRVRMLERCACPQVHHFVFI
ncbi:somatomedin-B and thrombospondin type-1 domain-containing protein-like [Scleropages formosus]|uniref:Somatomedin-B and thrombospondin type-1 domain-containing protein-like n=1 Tax=Scleropages formosus TaxID=113540 RepID=A0A0P7XK26_SCLFO|nr:somatomedin-B and thrombospondin type-1 domain-containing protein-like [Scleropages formosus]